MILVKFNYKMPHDNLYNLVKYKQPIHYEMPPCHQFTKSS